MPHRRKIWYFINCIMLKVQFNTGAASFLARSMQTMSQSKTSEVTDSDKGKSRIKSCGETFNEPAI